MAAPLALIGLVGGAFTFMKAFVVTRAGIMIGVFISMSAIWLAFRDQLIGFIDGQLASLVDNSSFPSGLSEALGFVNNFFPITELLNFLIAYLSLVLSCLFIQVTASGIRYGIAIWQGVPKV